LIPDAKISLPINAFGKEITLIPWERSLAALGQARDDNSEQGASLGKVRLLERPQRIRAPSGIKRSLRASNGSKSANKEIEQLFDYRGVAE
jgi:hypothetical protein